MTACCVVLAAVAACSGGTPRETSALPVRLVDSFEDAALLGRVDPAATAPAPSEWRFDTGTAGWEAGPGVVGFEARNAALVGRASNAVPLVHVERRRGLATDDLLHAVEVRARVSAGARLGVRFQSDLVGGLAATAADPEVPFWGYYVDLEPGDAVRSYTIPIGPRPTRAAQTRHVILRPTDTPGASFAVESVRLVFRREHLATLPSGRAWQGLGEIYQDALLLRTGEGVTLPSRLPPEPRLELSLGTVEPGPVTFRVAVVPSDGSAAQTVLQRTLTTPHRWESASADLGAFAGKSVEIALSASGAEPGIPGFFGNPVIRSGAGVGTERPQVVILILADTLRRDHLDAYGYRRATAPNLARAAEEGALFERPVAQASWTKVSAPSLLTSLYPSSHGVTRFDARLADEAVTLAEVFRDAGYATLGYSSIFFTGRFSNLQQGYEILHEAGSLEGEAEDSKTARTFVDRLLDWLDRHPRTPVFVVLHLFDPHDPFEPRPPYDALWADAAQREAHERKRERARGFIRNPVHRGFAMPAEAELRAAGVDPFAYVEHEMDWYDGSIRGLDAELVRVFERLQNLGLAERSLVAFTSDHGEEFHEHGRMFHGHSLYGELVSVPLFFWGPGRVPAGLRVDALVQSIDVFPTLVELAGIAPPAGIQGRTLSPYFELDPLAPSPPVRPAFAEQHGDPVAGLERADVDSVAVVAGRWKLIHNTRAPEGVPEFELYDTAEDRFERRNLAEELPDVVERLRGELDGWRQRTAGVRLPAGRSSSEDLGPEERARLRALGYLSD